MDLLTTIPIGVSITGLLVGFIVQHFAFISKIQSRLTALETKMDLFWNVVQQRMVDIIKSPHTIELDCLLEDLVNGGLNLNKTIRLEQLLLDSSEVPKEKQLAVALLLGRVRQLRYDLDRRRK